MSCGGGDRVFGLPGPLNLGGGCGSDGGVGAVAGAGAFTAGGGGGSVGLLFLLPLDLGLL